MSTNYVSLFYVYTASVQEFISSTRITTMTPPGAHMVVVLKAIIAKIYIIPTSEDNTLQCATDIPVSTSAKILTCWLVYMRKLATYVCTIQLGLNTQQHEEHNTNQLGVQEYLKWIVLFIAFAVPTHGPASVWKPHWAQWLWGRMLNYSVLAQNSSWCSLTLIMPTGNRCCWIIFTFA